MNILLVFNFATEGTEVIYEVMDGAICVTHEVILHFLEVLGANAHENDFDAHIKAGGFGPPLYLERILVGF